MGFEVHVFPRAERPTSVERYAEQTLRSRLMKWEAYVRRLGIRFDDVVTASGGRAVACRVHVTLAHVFEIPTFVVEGRAAREREAVDLAADALEGAVGRAADEVERRRHPRRRHGARDATSRALKGGATAPPEMSVHSHIVQEEIVAHQEEEGPPEVAVRDGPTPRGRKTAHPMRGRHVHKTQREARASWAREVSAGDRPSRKSTRRSANRSKNDSNQTRHVKRKVHSPKARAERGG